MSDSEAGKRNSFETCYSIGLGHIHTHLQIMLLATCCRAGAPNFMAMMKEDEIGEGICTDASRHCTVGYRHKWWLSVLGLNRTFMSQISLPQ